VNRIDGKEATCDGDCVGGSTPLLYENGKVGARALDTSNGARMLMGPIDYSVSAHFSVCAWLKANSHGGWQTAVGRWTTEHSGIHIFHLGLEAGSIFAEYGEAGGGKNKLSAPAGTMPVGRWTHVCEAVSTRDGGKKQMWVDGEFVGEVPNEGAAAYAHNAGTFNMVLGDKCESGPNKWDGAIDDVKMWDVAITQEEAKAAFEADVQTEEDHEAEEEEAPITETEASPDGSELPATIDPFPASCSFSNSRYNPATDTCGSGTHISQLTKVDLGQGYWAFADASGHKMIPTDEGGSAGQSVPYGSSVSTILGACTGKDGCRAIATDERQTSWMKSTECMSPCFRRYVNWYMAFNDESPGPFNPDRQS
jgi:hypothetical protein